MLYSIYNLLVYLVAFLFQPVSIFNEKIRKRIKGNQQWKMIPQKNGGYDVWMHCASLGEYEQGKPVIEKLKKRHPNFTILLTFFSPSGFENVKANDVVDFVAYMPFDTRSNAEAFIKHVKPQVVFFVKYELWPNFILAIHKKGIKCYLISAVFSPRHWLIKFAGKKGVVLLSCFSRIFTQNQVSLDTIIKKGLKNGELSGDTRIDRAIQVSSEFRSYEIINRFCDGSRVLVFGSTWPADEKIIIPFLIENQALKGWKWIIAPHEIHEKHLSSLMSALNNPSIRYTKMGEGNIGPQILILDTVGMLKHVYAKADLVYIGGGFGKSIHNILEPAVFNIPVIFGPNFKKFKEAKELVTSEGAFSIKDYYDFLDRFHFIVKEENYIRAQTACRQFFHTHRGSTDRILRYLEVNSIFMS